VRHQSCKDWPIVRRLVPTRDRLAAVAANARNTPRAILFELRRRRLARRYLRGSGFEIGALHRPLRVPSGVTVRYVDRMDRATLRRHYPELADHELVEVDVIDDGEKLGSLAESSADFIIANHFIEHTEDPLGTLSNHLRVLRSGGILYLAVPDCRRTFDAGRRPTALAHLVDDHAQGPSRSRKAHLEEWASLVERVPPTDVSARVCELDEQDYSIHFHVWTPTEFRALLQYAHEQQHLRFTIEALRDNGQEFIAILRRTGPDETHAQAGRDAS
jgi:SAM-dependent methyltransferase